MTGKSETVTDGRKTIGTVISLPRGHEAYAAIDGYLATFPSVQAARKAIYEAHRAVRAGR